MPGTTIAIGEVRLEVVDRGSGEPVVFVQTGLTADELLPLASDPAFDGDRTILYHRRGYAGSSPADGPGSIPRDADDCAGLLAELGIARAHIVGLSLSGAIGLELASAAPHLVRTLTLIEPPPVHTASSPEFRAANQRLLADRRAGGIEAALDRFLTLLMGRDWERVAEQRLPGSVEQMQRDAGTFFDTDIPALLGWRYGREDASRIGCPVLYVGGTDSGTWFAEVRDLMRDWIPHAEEVTITGADHSLALTHAPEIARHVADFVHRHPVAEERSR